MRIRQHSDPAQTRALTTGQAARICFVTPETILNWIKAGRLKAFRTVGGQYRIRTEDLRAFMAEYGMEPALLDLEGVGRPHCWAFHEAQNGPYGSPRLSRCGECLVKRHATLNCWELHGLIPLTGRRIDRCEACAYFRRYGAKTGPDSPCPSGTGRREE